MPSEGCRPLPSVIRSVTPRNGPAHTDVAGGLAAQGEFGAVHAEYPRVAAWSAAHSRDFKSRYKP